MYLPIQMQPAMRRPQIPWTLNRSYYGTPSEALQVTPDPMAAFSMLCLLESWAGPEAHLLTESESKGGPNEIQASTLPIQHAHIKECTPFTAVYADAGSARGAVDQCCRLG